MSARTRSFQTVRCSSPSASSRDADRRRRRRGPALADPARHGLGDRPRDPRALPVLAGRLGHAGPGAGQERDAEGARVAAAIGAVALAVEGAEAVGCGRLVAVGATHPAGTVLAERGEGAGAVVGAGLADPPRAP